MTESDDDGRETWTEAPDDADYQDNVGLRLQGEFDAVVWAREFLHIIVEPKIEIDEGLMIGWFSNAIMAGYDYARNHPEGLGSTVTIAPGAIEDML